MSVKQRLLLPLWMMLFSISFNSCVLDPEFVVYATSIELSSSSVMIQEGEKVHVNAVVLPKDADEKTVVWSTSGSKSKYSNITPETIEVQGMEEGQMVISAEVKRGTHEPLRSSITIDVTPKISSLTLNKTLLTLVEGESEALIATISPDNVINKNVVWKTSNVSVATVDQSGAVRAIKPGTATITVTTEDGSKTATCSVTVKAATVSVTSVSLNKSTLTLTEGVSETLIATVSPSDATNKNVSWQSSNTLVATVSSTGKVTAVKAGTATITVTTEDGSKTATCSVTVKAATVSVTSVSLNKSTLTLIEGTSEKLTATISPTTATSKTVSWTSSNTTVAKVSSTGVVTAVKAGTATITVKTEDGSKTATCSVTVKAATVSVTSVSLNKSMLTLIEGASETLTATIAPSTATNKNVSWKSSNTSVATVSSTGKVTAVKAGTATITVTTEDGSKTATCSVTVKASVYYDHEYVDLGLSVCWATMNLGSTKPEEYGLYYQWGDNWGHDGSDDKSFGWSYNGNTTYKWCMGSSKTLTKYNNNISYGPVVDYKHVLERTDDGAVEWGGSWRMPTINEWDELRESCEWTWTYNYNRTGVSGMIVKSKKPGYTDRFIFLPVAGYMYKSYSGTNQLHYGGSRGYYWSSSLDYSYPFRAYVLFFRSDYVFWGENDRCYGSPIRAVCILD